jgi:ribosome-binding factor A
MREKLVRRERLVAAIREILSELLLRESKDPRLHGVVISAVDLSGDLKLAKAFFSVIGDAERERQALDGLQQARGFLRHQMAQRLRMHSPPDLTFKRDKGFERADRISRLLDTISKQPTGDEAGGETEAVAPTAADLLPQAEDSTVVDIATRRPVRSRRD